MSAVRTAVTVSYERLHDDSAATRDVVETLSDSLPAARIALYESLDSVEHLWRRFERQAHCTVFQTFAYLAAWQKHIGSREHVRPVIAVVFRDGDVSAIFPLAVSGGFIRRLSWLGQDHCDYCAPLLAQDFAQSIGASFPTLWNETRSLMQGDPRYRHDLIDFRKMPEMIGAQRNPFLGLSVSLNASSAHLTVLSGTWDEFYAAKRSGLKRRRDRNSRKRLAESGDVRMVTPTDDTDILQTLETLIRQKSAALKRMGAANLFARPGTIDFYRDLATSSSTRDLLHVSRLDVGPVAASVAVGLQFRNRYHYILASYDDGAISRFSPGAAHLRDLLARAVECGNREFDFTIGDERYKYEWSDVEIKLYDLRASSTLSGQPIVLLARVFNAAKRTIKQTPVLWNTFQRLRAAAGAVREQVQD